MNPREGDPGYQKEMEKVTLEKIESWYFAGGIKDEEMVVPNKAPILKKEISKELWADLKNTTVQMKAIEEARGLDVENFYHDLSQEDVVDLISKKVNSGVWKKYKEEFAAKIKGKKTVYVGKPVRFFVDETENDGILAMIYGV